MSPVIKTVEHTATKNIICRLASRLYVGLKFLPVAHISERVALPKSRPLSAFFITSKAMCRVPISTTISHHRATVSNYAYFQ